MIERRLAKAAGFTLIEVLIALAILGSVLMVFARTVSTEATSSQRADAAQQAVLFARSTLSRLGRDIALQPGTQTGALEGGGNWTLTIRPLRPEEGKLSPLLVRAAAVVELSVAPPGIRPIQFSSLRLFGQWLPAQ